MALTVIKVQKDDTTIIKSIIEGIIDGSEEKPSVQYLQKLLTDDRT